MNRLAKVLGLMSLVAAMLVASMATVLAAENVDWNSNVIRATGGGVAPAGARTMAQARMMARRAAIADAYRQLAEYVGGVNVDSETTVDMAAVQSDVIRTKVKATIRGARIVSEGQTSDGGYEVTMEVPMFGVSSLASAVIDRPAVREAFPQQVPNVLPAPVKPHYSATDETIIFNKPDIYEQPPKAPVYTEHGQASSEPEWPPFVAPVPSSVEMAVFGSKSRTTLPKKVSSVRWSSVRFTSALRLAL